MALARLYGRKWLRDRTLSHMKSLVVGYMAFCTHLLSWHLQARVLALFLISGLTSLQVIFAYMS